MVMRLRFIHLLLGFILSFLFAWVVGNLFGDSIVTYVWDQDLDLLVVTPDSIHQHRSEGWASTKVGKHGVNVIPDIKRLSCLKIAIWGDSHVEGYCVDDNEKVSEVFSDLAKEYYKNEIIGFSIGLSRNKLADYYVNIPKYDKLCHSIIAHFIILPRLIDASPIIKNDANFCNFISSPNYQLNKSNWSPPQNRLRYFLAKYNLNFIWIIARDIASNINLRFKLGPVESEKNTPKHEHQYSVDAWNFLLTHLRKQSPSFPIIIVYCPEVAVIKGGTLVSTDPDGKYAELFKRACSEHNIDFINMADEFNENYRQTGKLPRGFPNSRPSMGHMNAVGQRLVAEAILKYTRENILRKVGNDIHSN